MDWDNETKSLLCAVGFAFVVILIAKPKRGSLSTSGDEAIVDKYQAPKSIDNSKKKLQDGAIAGLTAMRTAINDRASAQDLNDLKKLILEQDGIKILISKQTKQLRAVSASDGTVIAEEETKS